MYRHTNKKNGKVYMGITHDLETRWSGNGTQYRRFCNGTRPAPFYAAILKYGWDGFEHEVIAEELTLAEACKMEIDLIAQHRSNISRYGRRANGYNLTDGGEGTRGRFRTEKEKARLSECMSGDGNPMYGRKHTESAKEKISAHMSGRYVGSRSVLFGKHPSEDSRRKMSESHADVSGGKNPRARGVLCVELNLAFECQKDAEKYFNNAQGITRQNIGRAASGKQKTAGGYHWAYI